MGDLTRINRAECVEITDGQSLSVAVATAEPTGTEAGLIVRNIPSGTQSTFDDTSAITNDGVQLTPLFAAFGAASSGDNTLIAAVPAKKIRVVAFMGICAAAQEIYFTSGAAGSVIFGGSTNKMSIVANGGFVLPYNPVGWFETGSAAALVCNLSSATSFSGGITYITI